MNTSYKTVVRHPTVEEYNMLRAAAGWPMLHNELVELGLSKTLYAVVVQQGAETIGMGRIIGDGAVYFHIQDVIVKPENQKQGVGGLIMNELMKFLKTAGGVNTNIGLMCSAGREAFYKRFGFIERPNEKFGAGMIMVKQE